MKERLNSQGLDRELVILGKAPQAQNTKSKFLLESPTPVAATSLLAFARKPFSGTKVPFASTKLLGDYLGLCYARSEYSIRSLYELLSWVPPGIFC